ncbi:hypothetical protein A6P54_14750 [Bacillus sp. MKU004]|nr:hypothetical protein A6P54_14750 [Bacillus sp. MKU004]
MRPIQYPILLEASGRAHSLQSGKMGTVHVYKAPPLFFPAYTNRKRGDGSHASEAAEPSPCFHTQT